MEKTIQQMQKKEKILTSAINVLFFSSQYCNFNGCIKPGKHFMRGTII